MEKNQIKLEGNILHFDQKNLNGRTYTKKVSEEIVEQYNNIRGEDGVFFGELGTGSDGVNLMNVSHDVVSLKINEKNKTIEGTLLILDTPAGKKVLEMMKSNQFELSCRPRGTGTVNEKGEIEDFKIVSFDLIPTSNDAFANIKKNDSIKISDNE